MILNSVSPPEQRKKTETSRIMVGGSNGAYSYDSIFRTNPSLPNNYSPGPQGLYSSAKIQVRLFVFLLGMSRLPPMIGSNWGSCIGFDSFYENIGPWG